MMVKGKVAFITGAGWKGGIGKQIAMTLSENGAVVIINDIDGESVQETVTQLANRGATAEAAVGDVTDFSRLQELVKGVVDRHGRIDILVNNAGIRSSGPLEDLSVEHIDSVIAVNLKGVILCSKAVIPFMKKQRYGRIISITSIAAKMGAENSGHPHQFILRLRQASEGSPGLYPVNWGRMPLPLMRHLPV